TAEALRHAAQIAGGYSGGKAVSHAGLAPLVDVSVVAGTVTAGAGITLAAGLNALPDGSDLLAGGLSVNAFAKEAAASLFVGTSGSEARATDSSVVHALVPGLVSLAGGSGVVAVSSASYASLQAASSGLTVGG